VKLTRLPEGADVWLVPSGSRTAATVVTVGWCVLAAGVTLSGGAAGDDLLLWVVAVVIAVIAWRWSFVPYVALTPDAVIVQNMFSRTEVPYTDVESIAVSYSGVTIRRASGRPVVPWAVQKSGRATLMHKESRADELAVAIRDRLPAGR
jgi:hypothetical protein